MSLGFFGDYGFLSLGFLVLSFLGLGLGFLGLGCCPATIGKDTLFRERERFYKKTDRPNFLYQKLNTLDIFMQFSCVIIALTLNF